MRLIAESREMPALGTIERVGPGKVIIEFKAESARLFGFQDDDGGYTFVCVETFWIGHGHKKQMQDKAIAQASDLRARWRAAQPKPGDRDTRVQ
jgi:hypothetical protein